MKIINVIFSMFVLVSCANPKETNYTASTPAGPVVRSFLGIPLTDSIDFIRWKISFSESHYTLACNYGIGKPNTGGFINGGKTIDVSGILRKGKNIYLLQNGDKTLQLAELNADLLHIMDSEDNLLAGNGGWSYTINNMKPSVMTVISMNAGQTILKDSMVFNGRTPCGVPGVIAAGHDCYKLKWRIVLYADSGSNQPTTYKAYVVFRSLDKPRTGNWKMIKGKNNRITYGLYDDSGKIFLNLISPGENILLFTDANGKLLVGNEDFSYTLNKRL